MSDLERFMDKVSMVPIAGCWIWTASVVSSTGYGRFGIGEIVEYAHRASWLLMVGPIPKGLYVCHHCDVPSCVNPHHLFIGTAKDNMRDASAKGRIVLPPIEAMRRAENQPMAKLTNDLVREVRRAAKVRTQSAIARELGLNPSTISLIVNKKTYASVQ